MSDNINDDKFFDPQGVEDAVKNFKDRLNADDVEKAKGWIRSHKEELLAGAMVGGVLLIGYRLGFKRADKKTVKALATVFGVENVKSLSALGSALDEMQRQALGYGFEIGNGAPLLDVVSTSAHNPFLDPNWRTAVKSGVDKATSTLASPKR